MDPIHPILPQPPNIPPVLPATNAGRIDRDAKRRWGARDDEPPRRRRPAQSVPATREAGEEPDGDGSSHIDVTA